MSLESWEGGCPQDVSLMRIPKWDTSSANMEAADVVKLKWKPLPSAMKSKEVISLAAKDISRLLNDGIPNMGSFL